MGLRKLGSFYVDPDKIIYVKRILPELKPASALGANRVSGFRIGFDNTEITLYEDEPGYAEFLDWLEARFGRTSE